MLVLFLRRGGGGGGSSSLSSPDSSSSESPGSSSEELSSSSSSSAGCCGRLLLVRSLSGLAAVDDAGGVGAISPVFGVSGREEGSGWGGYMCLRAEVQARTSFVIVVQMQLHLCPRYEDMLFQNGWYDGELSSCRSFKNGNPQTLIPWLIDGISFLKAASKGPRYKGVWGGGPRGIWCILGGCCSWQGLTSLGA